MNSYKFINFICILGVVFGVFMVAFGVFGLMHEQEIIAADQELTNEELAHYRFYLSQHRQTDSYKITKLEEKVEKLEARVKELEESVLIIERYPSDLIDDTTTVPPIYYHHNPDFKFFSQ